MDIDQFKREIRREFGPHLENATPANVRDFLDNVQDDIFQNKLRKPFVIDEDQTTYEAILRDFFARVLDFPRDEALIMLWTMAFDLSFTTLELHLAERFDALFREPETP